jgi:hypothetical protein
VRWRRTHAELEPGVPVPTEPYAAHGLTSGTHVAVTKMGREIGDNDTQEYERHRCRQWAAGPIGDGCKWHKDTELAGSTSIGRQKRKWYKSGIGSICRSSDACIEQLYRRS